MSETPLLGRHDPVPRRRWRWLLPLLLSAAVIALVTSLVVRANEQDSSPEHAVEAYLNALEDGELNKAYGLLCAQRPPLDQFKDEIAVERRQNGGVLGHRLDRVEVRGNGQRVAYYTVRHQEIDQVFSVALVRESGEWRLCGFGQPTGLTDRGVTTTTR